MIRLGLDESSSARDLYLFLHPPSNFFFASTKPNRQLHEAINQIHYFLDLVFLSAETGMIFLSYEASARHTEPLGVGRAR